MQFSNAMKCTSWMGDEVVYKRNGISSLVLMFWPPNDLDLNNFMYSNTCSIADEWL